MVVYTRITEEERTLIHRWIQEGEPQSEMARRLSRNPGSISREIGRNTGLRGYRPKHAHEKANAQAKRAGPRRFTDEVRTDAEARLKEGWTPAIIGGRARLEGRPWVCAETIYQHVYADAKAGGTLWKNLPRAKRTRRRRCPRQDGRGPQVEERRRVLSCECQFLIGSYIFPEDLRDPESSTCPADLSIPVDAGRPLSVGC